MREHLCSYRVRKVLRQFIASLDEASVLEERKLADTLEDVMINITEGPIAMTTTRMAISFTLTWPR